MTASLGLSVSMRRTSLALLVVAVIAAVLAAPARATFHLNMVNEVMLASATGDASSQFVEFLDNGGTEEQFTPLFAPYKLIVYDGAGNELGRQTLNASGLRAAAAADKEYLVSTPSVDTAFGVTGDERLTVALPLRAGQVCFAGNESAPQAVSCMTYGTITKPVQTNSFGTGSIHGPVPPNGESDQRQPNGTVVAAPPTPKAANRAAPPPVTIGKPALSHVSLTGVAERRAKLAFAVRAGLHAPALERIAVSLPRGLSFDANKLATGVSVSDARGHRLGFGVRLRRGALLISLSNAARNASVTVSRGAISVARRLSEKVKKHQVKRLTVALVVTDANGTVTKRRANVHVS